MNTIGCLIIDIEGKSLTSEDVEILQHPLVGGVILFSRNFESRTQLISLCSEMRRIKKLPMLIMTDQEGGRVQRFKEGFTRLPPMATFGELYDTDGAQNACQQAYQCGSLLATELLQVGIDLGLSPVLDLNNSISNVIGDRAFHRDPLVISSLASAFIKGMESAGMAAVGKHFPGHGSIAADSHVNLPIDNRSYAQIEQTDLIPFAATIAKGLPAVMAAHIIFPNIDKLQVGFSSVWLQEILRKRLNFNGTIFSDDLSMAGANISSRFDDRVLVAREAGCDFALVCNNRSGVIEVLDTLNHAHHQISEDRWRALAGKN
jgi:beta-N-acetylhexosaminidase